MSEAEIRAFTVPGNKFGEMKLWLMIMNLAHTDNEIYLLFKNKVLK